MRHSLLALLVPFLAARAARATMGPPTRLRVEYIDQADWALVDTPRPRFSWVPDLEAGQLQSAYSISVRTAAGTALWDSGKVESAASFNVAFGADDPVPADTAATVSVRVWDQAGQVSPWSDPFSFVVGPRASGDWRGAAWIACNQTGEFDAETPTYARNRFRTEVRLPAHKGVTSARLYVAGTGIARAFVNGQTAGSARARLQAGWTAFRQRVLYTYADVTGAVQAGGDSVALALELGNGWADVLPAAWNGSDAQVSVPWRRGGALRKAVAMLVVDTLDGPSFSVVTGAPGAPAVAFDGVATAPLPGVELARRPHNGTARQAVRLNASWSCGGGPRVNDSIYDGEAFHAGRQTPGWGMPGWSPPPSVRDTWAPALAAWPFSSAITLSAQAMPAVATQADFPGSMKEVRNSSAGPRVWVWDFGQNMAGAVRLTVPEGTPSGATFVIKHAEVLMHPPYGPVDGSVYTGNLRSALATDTYVHDGVTESHEFGEATYHGFRFAQLAVSGVPESWAGPNDKTLVAVHFRTDVAREGSFSAGDATGLLDKIHHAAAWVQAANLMSLPSDCPQRDERKGWMGDSALSTESFFYNFDMPALFGQWVQAMRDQQVNPFQPEHGASVGDTTPLTFGSAPGDPSWQTAYPTAVSQLWHYAEDRQLLGSILGPLHQYAAALSSAANATGLKKMFAHYGEWVTPPAVLPTSPNDSTQGPKPPKSLVSAFNFISDLDRMVELSAAAGDAAAARQYVAEAAARREEFDQAFWDWTINAYGAGFANRDGLQVSNILAAALGVKHAEEAFLSTVYDIEVTHAGKLAVGISGSKNLFRQLTLHGYSSLAVDLMLQREYPSFGFMIDGGTHGYEPATTLWELWTAPVSGPGMNSRAHHMFSAGPEMWFFEHVAGLGLQCGGQTGFACLRIHPRVTAQPQIPWANATVPTLRGPATVSWTNGTSVAAARLAGGEAANRASQGLRADNGQLLLSVRLPVGGASAEVVVPAGDTGPGLLITANGELAWAEGEFVSGCQGVAGASAVDGGVEFLVGPGGAFVFSATFA